MDNPSSSQPTDLQENTVELKKRSTWTAALSTFFLALVPVFKSCPPCPLCMPKYAALLSFLGLPLADYNHYLMPIMLISMAITVGSLMIQGPKHYHSKSPAFMALGACLVILLSRFVDTPWVSYTGMAALFVALIFHQIKLQSKTHTCCDGHHH